VYAAFHDRIQGPHGAVHSQIGGVDENTGQPLGEMADIEHSPRDVLFWLHHAFLDKLWNDWSTLNPAKFPRDGSSPHTHITDPLLPLDVFSRTSRQVFLISDLGYSYQ
jgi:tyrosinase